ncbi:hypothetical protein Zm00014a_028727 [Zea mays]|uniref:Uncharacterized protein n=1 Tax=Zea mays TaxID=4577 RepID=A0A3L6G182_MAIZE|nr:hypothetical protein Zm00014a_028727 [Zea mays]
MPNCFSKTKQARMMIMYLLENKLSKTYLLLHFSKTIDHTQEVQIRKQAVATPVRFSDGSRQGLTMEKSTVVVSVPVVVMAETAETDYSSSFSLLVVDSHLLPGDAESQKDVGKGDKSRDKGTAEKFAIYQKHRSSLADTVQFRRPAAPTSSVNADIVGTSTLQSASLPKQEPSTATSKSYTFREGDRVRYVGPAQLSSLSQRKRVALHSHRIDKNTLGQPVLVLIEMSHQQTLMQSQILLLQSYVYTRRHKCIYN